LFHCQVFAVESSVKVSVETLTLNLESKAVAIDVYKPIGPHTGAAILTHGGFRSRKTMAEHALALAARGVLTIAPNMPCMFDHRCNARAIAELVNLLRSSNTFGKSASRVMLVGFSAGGLSSLLAADTPGVVGFVGLDAYDHLLPNQSERLGVVAARRLDIETLLLRAPASSCNGQSVAASWRLELKALWRDEMITGASHCDFEAPTDWMCRLACGDTDASRQSMVRQGLLDAAARWLP
jgi:pimeloyl-ACP methyl ester carboxylesterase